MKKLNKSIKEFINGTATMFKEFFHKETNKKQRANMWSFTRFILVIPILVTFIIYIINKKDIFIIVSGSLAIIGAITDFFDGKSARKYKSISDYGKKLDQIADKTFCATLSLCLAILHHLFIITLVLEILIIIINSIFNLKYPDINNDSNMIGKIKQWPLFALLFIGFFATVIPYLYNVALGLFIITTLMQIITILSYINKHVKEIQKLLSKKLKGTNN